MENIRLIIWDLDETFWNGTLSEGTVYIPDEHKRIIKVLAERGIISSISSKNDECKVKSVLHSEALWDYFVFPRINWETKGAQIKYIIESMKLRPETVLFIDDNISNREEAKFYNPKIEVAAPEIIHSILDDPHFTGKDDRHLSRLKQYKVMEKKWIDEQKLGDNEEFLRQSGIQVSICRDDLYSHLDRIYELNQRTNQLNFTKVRLSENEIKDIIYDESYDKGYIKVQDNYGDYGIVGFFACKNNELEQFYFSCRTIGLGVEQWVYSQLNFPHVNIIGDVATRLDYGVVPDWINRANNDNAEINPVAEAKMLLLGGCDLEQTAYYLAQTGMQFTTQFNYLISGRFNCHPECTELIRQSVEYSYEEKEMLINKCPFYDASTYKNHLFDQEYDVIVYSPLIDMSIGLYHMKENPDLKVVYGNVSFPNMDGHGYMKEKERAEFAKDFQFDGGIPVDRLYSNLLWIRERLPKATHLILINASEVNISHPYEPDRYLIHKEANKMIKAFCESNDNTYLLDVTTLIKGEQDHTDTIRHYNRNIYFAIAKQILSYIEEKGITKGVDLQYTKDIKIPMRVKVKKYLRKVGLLDVAYKINTKLYKK